MTLPLTACSAGGDAQAVLPNPEQGKVSSFALGELSTRYDVDDAVAGSAWSSSLAWDRSGNVYMMNAGGNFDILRMTPQGKVSRFAHVSYPGAAHGMAATPDGGVIIGGDSGLLQVNRKGASGFVRTSHQFVEPRPIGVRPDGSIIVLDGKSVWALKDDKATSLYGSHGGKLAVFGTVDASGTAYVQLTGQTFADMLVLPLGQAPHRLPISGKVPGSRIPISALSPQALAPALGGGFYARGVYSVGNSAKYASYVIHVRKTTGTVLIKATHDRICPAGEQYPALDSPCTMPWFVTQMGDRVLVMGSNTMSGKTVPALTVRANTK
ncbi:hypothetical protein AQI95_16445 [Streptomyces yokosukanensis]|uniref:SMP-30/Gluconolactonase/LRE-like region domain-containing protein n=2 Tax=Streptomyces yokosukanensis TaxID=67386 RepID=A0A101P545_9ACTN|nr:hypothetical protein AQI95_16445 [Streptomyces yokosukanensis]